MMNSLPTSEYPLLLRTDFSNDDAWESLCESAQQINEMGFWAHLVCVSDLAYDQLSLDQFIALTSKRYETCSQNFACIADRTTFASSERPILVVDLYEDPGRTFRVIPREMWGIENNLSISNMDFSEFANNTDPDGVFRGFPEV